MRRRVRFRTRSGTSVAAATALLVVLGGALAVPVQARELHRPAVTGLSQHSGPDAGGSLVTIRGRHLRGTYEVDFGTDSARVVRVISDRAVQVRTPRYATDDVTKVHVSVYVRNRGGTPHTSRDVFAFVAPPAVHGLSAHALPTSGGRLGLHGANLRAVRAVSIGGVHATHLRSTSPDSLWVTAPRHSAGRVTVRVRTAYGVSTSTPGGRLTYVARPVVTKIGPTSGSTAGHGQSVRITGRNLASVTRVAFGSVAGTVVDHPKSDTTIYVDAPPHTAGTVHVRVASVGGSSATGAADHYTYETPFPNPSTWTSQKVFDYPWRGYMIDVDCPDPAFCVAIDARSASTFSDGRWSEPHILSDSPLQAVSCAVIGHCVAIARSGATFVLDGGAWTTSAAAHPASLSTLSCPTVRTCAATGDSTAFVLKDGSWSTAMPLTQPTARWIAGLSCATETFCVAASDSLDGTVYVYDGENWTAEAIDPRGDLHDVSCARADLCMAIDQHGYAVRWDGARWAEPENVFHGTSNGWRIDCHSSGRCVATSTGSRPATFDGTTWTLSDQEITRAPGFGEYIPYVEALSCASADQCVAVDRHGDTIRFRDGTWAAPALTFDTNSPLSAISCVSVRFCVSTDSGGHAYTFDGTRWSAPQRPLAAVGVANDVSCTSSTFCLMVSSAGGAATYDGANWHPIDGPQQAVSSVDCISDTRCVAPGAVFDGTTWRDTAGLPAGTWDDISCSSASFCLAAGRGRVSRFDGARWGAADPVDAPPADGARTLDHVACVDDSCVLVAGSGRAARLQDGRWSTPEAISTSASTPVSCASSSFCVAAAGYGTTRVFDGTRWSQPGDLPSSSAVRGVACPAVGTCVLVGGDTAFVGHVA